MATPAPTPVQCNTSNPSYVTYRNWARALAERLSNDQAKRLTRQSRDTQIKIEFQRLSQSAQSGPTVARLVELIDDLVGCPDLGDDIEEIANRDTPPSKGGTEPAYFNTLTSMASDIRDYQERLDIWQETEDILGREDLTRARTAIQNSHILARVELGALVDKWAYGQKCLDSLRVLQRDAPRENMSVALPTYAQLETAFDQKTAFGGGTTGLQSWGVDGNFLGQGANGRVHVYISNDSNGQLTDRIVVKKMVLNEALADQAKVWQNGDNIGRERAAEAWNHWLGSSRHRANNNIVAYRNWQKVIEQVLGPMEVVDETTVYLYTAYCPNGPLTKTIEAHAALVRGATGVANTLQAMLPENFVWSVFSGLASAICVLRHGRHPGWGESWDRHIVHCDVKPDNIFLSLPRSDGKFPGYPNVELGDFGLALDMEEDFLDGTNNPVIVVPRGTQEWQAPEQEGYGTDNDEPSPLSHRIESHSDVFGIGLTVMALMNCADTPRNPGHANYQVDQWPDVSGYVYKPSNVNDFDNELMDGPGYPSFNSRAIAKYTATLRQLCLECVDSNPERRPGIDDLYRRIAGFVQDPIYNKEPGGTSIERAQASNTVHTDRAEMERKFAIP